VTVATDQPRSINEAIISRLHNVMSYFGPHDSLSPFSSTAAGIGFGCGLTEEQFIEAMREAYRGFARRNTTQSGISLREQYADTEEKAQAYRWRRAIHEAGHATAALIGEGIEPILVTIIPTDGAAGLVRWERAVVVPAVPLRELNKHTRRYVNVSTRKAVRSTLAGMAAEHIHLNSTAAETQHGGSTDLKDADDFLSRIYPSVSVRRRIITQMTKATRTFLEEPRQMLFTRKFAEILFHAVHLEGADLRNALEAALTIEPGELEAIRGAA
jgi:hypothetical protein